MSTKKYVGGKEASALLGIHQRTLYQWETKGKIETIRTPGNKRLYNVQKFLKEKEDTKCLSENELGDLDKLEGKLNISYVRVSSLGQKDDLMRQTKLISDAYPNHTMIEDIGSGVNMNRRGLRKIIKLAISGKINELAVAYKDRLSRFGYDLIENKKDDLEPEEELAFDVLQIMNVFVAKMNGLRKYKKKSIDIVK